MDSSANNSRHNTMGTEYDRAASASALTSPATTQTATTISTIVLQSHPIQIVVGLLQVKIKNASSFCGASSSFSGYKIFFYSSVLSSMCMFFFYFVIYLFSNISH